MSRLSQVSLVYQEGENYNVEKVGVVKDGEYYKLVAVPAFANNLAYGDIISVENENGELFFDELIRASGHSTVHLVVFDAEKSHFLFSWLATLGVGINYLNENMYLVIDIPPEVPYREIKEKLDLESGSYFDYKEACISDEHL